MSIVHRTAADSGQRVALQPGDELVVDVPENATTGYAWTIEDAGVPALRLLSADFAARATAGIGGSGTRTFRFAAAKTGHTELRLKCSRAWLGDTATDRRVSLSIDVAEPSRPSPARI